MTMGRVLSVLERLDRRWVFLAMALAVAGPILVMGITRKTLPETPTDASRAVFNAVQRLPRGSVVLLAFDFDPGSAGELEPMGVNLTRHCALRGHKMVFISLWPLGGQMIDETITKVLRADFPNLQDGVDFVNLGFQAGNEQVMRVVLSDFPRAFPTTKSGRATADLPILRDVRSVSDFALLASVSAGYPGSKEWVQYVVSASGGKLPMVSGCTGVQTPQLYPYFPGQICGLLGAIKGAAEYESLINEWVSDPANGAAMEVAQSANGAVVVIPPKYLEAQRRMGPQLGAHLLMVVLILLGNLVYLAQRRAQRRAAA
jgi:hypothetical protein